MPFRFDKLTIKAQEAVAQAQAIASERGHPEIDPLHLLAALLAEQEGVVKPILDRIGVNRPQLDADRPRRSWAISPRSPAGRRRSPTRLCRRCSRPLSARPTA